jgi:hypothetical protein
VKYLLLASLLASASMAYAQNNLQSTSQSILHEGLELYQLEQAAWLSTDLLEARHYPTQQINEYFSYASGDSIRTLFIGGRQSAPQVLTEFRSPRTHIRPATTRQLSGRELLAPEQALLAIRRRSLADLQHVAGAELPAHTAFNVVLLPKGPQVWVYVFTGATPGTTQRGVTLLGNDYLLHYKANGQLLTSKKLHPNLIPISRPQTKQPIQASLHLHKEGKMPFITPTDVCTLLLYQKQLPGRTHLVFSKKYVSIFSPADAKLTILTRQAFLARQAQLGR